ncbi:MAG: hypothetical protein IPN03_17015 [Holophagales bacterium]|nr:hypothetical protein [Holophagales bacterium]
MKKQNVVLVLAAALLAPAAFGAEPPPLPKDFPGYGAGGHLGPPRRHAQGRDGEEDLAPDRRGAGEPRGDLGVSAGADAITLRASAPATGTPVSSTSSPRSRLAPPSRRPRLPSRRRTPCRSWRPPKRLLISRVEGLAKAVYGSHPYHVVTATRETIAKTTSAILGAEHARRFPP